MTLIKIILKMLTPYYRMSKLTNFRMAWFNLTSGLVGIILFESLSARLLFNTEYDQIFKKKDNHLHILRQ